MKQWIEIPGNSALTDAIRMLNDNMRNMTVQTDDLGDEAVTTDKLADSAVDTDNISDAAIETYHVTDAAITDGKIESLTADKITAGTIDASEITVINIDAGKITTGTLDASGVTIQGHNGMLTLDNNTLTVTDANNNRRVSLGDVDGDGNLYGLEVRGADGETILYDANGITMDGIPTNIITRDKLGQGLGSIGTGDLAYSLTATANALPANMLANGSFENELASWSVSGCSASAVADPVDGANAVECAATGANNPGIYQNVSVTSGRRYYCRGYFKRTSGSLDGFFGFSDGFTGGSATFSESSYTFKSFVGTCTATGSRPLKIAVMSASVTETIRADSVMCIDVSTLPASIQALADANLQTLLDSLPWLGAAQDGKTITNGLNLVGSTPLYIVGGTASNDAPEENYYQIDFGISYRIAESRAFFYSADTRFYYYKIKYSADGTNWVYAAGSAENSGWVTSAPSAAGQPAFNPTINYFDPAMVARYVRLYVNGGSAGAVNALYEWELYSTMVSLVDGRQITVGTIFADKLAANTITAASGVIHDIDASTIQTGTMSAEHISGGTLILGGKVTDKSYDGQILLKREDGTIYGTHDRNGVSFYDSNGVTKVATLGDTGATLGNSTMVQFSLGNRSGVGIFTA